MRVFQEVDLENLLQFHLNKKQTYPHLDMMAKKFTAIELSTSIRHYRQFPLHHEIIVDERRELSFVDFEFAEVNKYFSRKLLSLLFYSLYVYLVERNFEIAK
jgi:hypothetical protein